jgi:predicted MFS family arabinose efflux permease
MTSQPGGEPGSVEGVQGVDGLNYSGEFRAHWRSLLAGVAGLSSGLSLITYITSLFAPYLLKEFGWSKAEFALTGVLGLVSLVCFPAVGHIADRFGVRRTAALGVVTLPLTFLAFSAMRGPISEYIAIYIVQATFGIATTSTVYSRLVAVRFSRARGLALSILAASPAVVAAVFTAPLTRFIEAHSWRAGFRLIAAYMLIFGLLTLLLIPEDADGSLPRQRTCGGRVRRGYQDILRNPAFWIVLSALVLCNLSQVLHASQLKLLLLAKGATSQLATTIFSLYAAGVMVGRFVSGLALDRLPAYAVAAVGLALPGIGMFLLASSLTAPVVLTASLLTMGLALGAEGDVIGYLTARYFGVEIYSSVLGILTAVVAASFALGSLLLSLTLRVTGNYSLFLCLCGTAGLVGGGIFMLLRRQPVARESVAAQVEECGYNAEHGADTSRSKVLHESAAARGDECQVANNRT